MKTSSSDTVNALDEPTAYKKGYAEFYKLRFLVNEDVLIPRPETELLVDEVLSFIKANSNQQLHILDLGTGAGPIAISMAKNLSSTSSIKITATEVSQEALEIAKQNAKLHYIEDRITFKVSDLLESLTEPADIIVTNLPYIPSARIAYLDSSVKDFEPHIALDGGEDGFELYRKLFQQTKDKGWQPKLILGEIDYTHGEIACDEAYKYFPDYQIEVKKDLAHLQRILIIHQ